MAVNISGLRRNIKNVACSYSPAQVKVREATSNDPWGPSSTVMSEVADLTYNIAAFSDVMQMIWKRLNDVGKNWRHVYKALVLLEYLLKTGCDKVIEESKMNLFIVKSLVDFQYLDDNKDQGVNVREKAKALVYLLKNEELLKAERVKALKAKFNTTREKHQANRWMRTSQSMIETSLSQLEEDRPQTKGEEDLQLELALAMSRGEVEVDDDEDEENEERDSKPHNYSDDDDDEFKLVSQQSEDNEAAAAVGGAQRSSLFDLVDLEFSPAAPSYNPDPFASAYPNQLGAKKSFSMDPLCMSTPNLSLFDQNRGVRDPWAPQIYPPPTPARHEAATTSDAYHRPLADESGFFHPRKSSNELGNVPLHPGGVCGSTQFDPWDTQQQSLSSSTRETPQAPRLLEDDPFSSSSQQILADFDNIRHDIEGRPSKFEETDPHNDPFVVKLDPSITDSSYAKSNASAPPLSFGEELHSGKPGVGSILNEHQNLVDLDNWSPFGNNPFEIKSTNPFQPAKQSTPMNKLIHQDPRIGASTSALDSFSFTTPIQENSSPKALQSTRPKENVNNNNLLF